MTSVIEESPAIAGAADVVAQMTRIADEVAAPAADEVDLQGRFPPRPSAPCRPKDCCRPWSPDRWAGSVPPMPRSPGAWWPSAASAPPAPW